MDSLKRWENIITVIDNARPNVIVGDVNGLGLWMFLMCEQQSTFWETGVRG